MEVGVTMGMIEETDTVYVFVGETAIWLSAVRGCENEERV